MIIRLDSAIKNKLARLAQAEGKNTSQVVREIIEEYIRNRDVGAYIDDLWDRVGKKLRTRNVGLRDIDRAIEENRASGK